jgi:DNA-binding GntR family transcriptional regulator
MDAVPTDNLDADYTPRYVKLARLLRGRIEDGTYPAGTLLPSSKRLAEAHDVSATTAIHALDMLKSNGYVRYIVGKPYQVIYGT